MYRKEGTGATLRCCCVHYVHDDIINVSTRLSVFRFEPERILAK